jgi:HNH endonuclease
MPDRPHIPEELKRSIFLEARHQCAVCGSTGSLEIAHIVPWHSSKEHKAEDLICLCPNCHSLADNRKWGEKALRYYKRFPHAAWWRTAQERVYSTCKVELKIDIELEEFDEKSQRWLHHAIAGFLEISPSAVQVVSIKRGTVRVTLRLPRAKAKRLLDAFDAKDPTLVEYLTPLIVLELRIPTTSYRVVEALVLDTTKSVRRSITDYFRIYSYSSHGPRLRLAVVAALLLAIIGSLFLSYHAAYIPASAIFTMACAGLLGLIMMVDSGLFVVSIVMSSLQRGLMLIRRFDRELSVAIAGAEQYVANTRTEKVELKSLAREFIADFENRRPFMRVSKALLSRTILNFWITILCFAAISMSDALWIRSLGSSVAPYGHACLDFGGFLAILTHFIYYHAVVFQSLGDSNHAPATLFAQILAVIEASVSYFYFIFIFGGFLSTAIFVQSEMAPKKLCNELYKRLSSLASAKNPITKS